MSPPAGAPSTHDKVQRLNLDERPYGTFAEIGAGQEVARWFFHVGGAAGTVAKSISAYDMAVSDAVYGQTHRYVSRERLEAMLACEFDAVCEQLQKQRGGHSTFFAFADTVATRSYSHRDDGHGWMGVRFQTLPGGPPSEIIIHVVLRDRDRVREQEAIGVVGVNLLHGAIYHHDDPPAVLVGLLDHLGRERVEIDTIKCSGPAFAAVDNRILSLLLVEHHLTDAAMFTAAGEVVQPAEILYKKAVVVERGRFRPVTKLTLDILEGAEAQLRADRTLAGQEPVALLEMTLRGLLSEEGLDHDDFLARVDLLAALGKPVLVSDYRRHFGLAEYLRRATQQPVALALGMPALMALADPGYYTDLAGGVLEAMGRLFTHDLRLYVYPTRDAEGGPLITAETWSPQPPFAHLYAYLRERGLIIPIERWKEPYLHIASGEITARIAAGDPSWEALVPPQAAETIRAHQLFGWRPGTGPP